jgi:NADH:ubiquinone oxidoreductase subunit C
MNKFILTTLKINGDTVLYCMPENISNALFFLKFHTLSRYRMVIDVNITDLITKFEIRYCLLSVTYRRRIRLKSVLSRYTAIQSCVPLFKSLGWSEREAWDLFGIYFKNHGDLRRILTDYGFNGHPLRKNFPLSGYVEVRYSSNKKRVSLESLELTQEFRSLDFSRPWLAQ